MRVVHQLSDLSAWKDSTSVAIGNFDGCHLGHQALIAQMRQDAERSGLVPTLLTFYPHPTEVLVPGKKFERLMTATEKLQALEKLGVEQVFVARFDTEVAGQTPEQFFRTYLVEGLSAKSIHVGFDFHFGKGRTGNTDVLKHLAAPRGIRVQTLPPFEVDGVKVSSSIIRELIRNGDCMLAGKYLGSPYVVTGQVSHGDHRGREMGFRTANVAYPEEKLLPKVGVYVTSALWQKQSFPSVTNIGFRPTFEKGPTAPRIEAHLLDFSAPLYQEFIQLEFYERIRDEMKFESVDALTTQITQDVARARASARKL